MLFFNNVLKGFVIKVTLLWFPTLYMLS